MKAKTKYNLLIGACLLFASGLFAQGTIPTTPTTTTAAASIGQTITLDGVAYKVSGKKVLATGVEHYTVKGTTPKAIAKYYLRSNNTYNPTVFTAAEFTSFYSTRRLSSFGTMQKVPSDGVDYWYSSKDATVIRFSSGKTNVLEITELPGMTVLALDNGSGCTCCIAGGCQGCADKARQCQCIAEKTYFEKCNPEIDQLLIPCTWLVNDAYYRCMDGKSPLPSNPYKPKSHFLTTSLPILFQ
ncbi:MAG: hypothetical protein JNL43_04500 [Flavobacteriales bacterium]|nr:hypothetical protein [Flavobacteriales bacterium]